MSDALYVGHDARLSFRVHGADGDPLDLTATGEKVGRAVFHLAGRVLDSDAEPAAFDWVTRGAEGILAIDLTGRSFPPGAQGARLVLYAPAYPAGLVVADGYPVRVEEALAGSEPPAVDLAALRTLLQSAAPGLGSDLVAWRGRQAMTLSDALDAATGVHGVGAGQVVGTTLAQTLTNKTLAAPQLSSPTLSAPVVAPADWAGAVHAHLDAATGGALVNRAVTGGHLSGFALANGAANTDIVVSPGVAAGETLSGMLVLASSLTKSLASTWTAGNGGGFPSGLTRSNGTWYHVFALGSWDAATKTWTVDAGFDTALDAANLRATATGFAEYRRVGSVLYVDASKGLRPFRQSGDRFSWQSPSTDHPDSAISSSRQLKALTVPQGLRVTAQATLQVDNDSTTLSGEYHCLALSPEIADAPASSTARSFTIGVWNDAGAGQAFLIPYRLEVETDLDRQIAIRWSASPSGVTYDLITLGWIDHRGRS